MKQEKAMSIAIKLYYSKSVKKGYHILYRIGNRYFRPIVLSQDDFDSVIKKHPRSYIGAYHC